MYVEDQDGMLGFGYKPTNINDFPHGASADIQSSTDFICSNLQNVCRAPTETVELCQTAAAAAQGKAGQDAAHAFNIAITASSSRPSASDAGTPSEDSADAQGSADAQDMIEPSLNMKFSTQFVAMEGHIDPVWWFNEYILADGQPSICDETPRRMPNDHYITFSCEGADPRIVPMMRDALNDFVQFTMYNETLKDRPFQQYYNACNGLICKPFDERTSFPQSVHIATALDIPGAGGALSGNLRYTISESTADNCGLCGFLSTGGGLASAMAGVSGIVLKTAALISPGISTASAVVSFSCLSTCK
ncbi:hypothetical protein ACLX1H_008050 [Fusarium chlamydosporum]